MYIYIYIYYISGTLYFGESHDPVCLNTLLERKSLIGVYQES